MVVGMESLKAVVVCCGQGTRIRDVNENLSRLMLPVGSLPVLWRSMKYYASAGYKEFVWFLGYRRRVIKDFILNYEARTRDFSLQLVAAKEIEQKDAVRCAGYFAALPVADCGDGLFYLRGECSRSIYEMTQRVAIRCRTVLGFTTAVERIELQSAVLDGCIAKLKTKGLSLRNCFDDETDAMLSLRAQSFGKS